MLTDLQWQAYRNTINQAHDSFNQDIVTWRRFARGFQRYGEDDPSEDHYTDIPLETLIAYNIFRMWPMTDENIGGALDTENVVMILNIEYLKNAGYLNSDGYFAMDPGKDIFVHKGLSYRASGETPAGQAGDDPLLFFVILKREETLTGTERY